MAGSHTYPGLDALRGYAALIVLAFHAENIVGLKLVLGGDVAVDLFFLLSGFVIAHAYDAKMPALGVRGFMLRRVIRLYPLYIVGVVIGLIENTSLRAIGHSVPPGVPTAIASALLFLPSPPTEFSTGAMAPLDGPAWSLIYEIWINLAFALLFPFLSRRVLVTVVLAAAVALVGFALQGINLGGPRVAAFPEGIARVCFSFPLGVLLYRNRALLPRLAVPVPVLAIFMLAFVSIAPVTPLASLIFVLLLSPTLVVLAMRENRSTVSARYGSATSYAIYILHAPLLLIASGLANHFAIDPTPLVTLVIVGILFAAPWIEDIYDFPVRRWLSGRFARQDVPAARAA